MEEQYIESMLLERLKILFQATDEGDDQRFDKNSELIEMILYQDEKIYNEFMEYKEKLQRALKNKLDQSVKDSSHASSSLSQKVFLEVTRDKIEWDYRNDYLWKIVEVLSKMQVISFQNKVELIKESDNEQSRNDGSENTKKDSPTQ